MSPIIRFTAAVVLAVAASAVLTAQAIQLDVRMGYWETTTTMQMGGSMPAMDTSGMPPQQKAQMEAMMKAMAGPRTITDKDCITREELDRDMLMLGDHDPKDCKRVLTMNTSRVLDGTVTCTGDEPSTTKVHLEALSPTSVTATFETTGVQNGTPMSVRATTTGKFLSATCPKE